MKRSLSISIGVAVLLVVAVAAGVMREGTQLEPRSWRVSESLTVSPTPPWRIDSAEKPSGGSVSELVLSNDSGSFVVFSPGPGATGREDDMAPWKDLISRGVLTGRIDSFTWSGLGLSSMVGVMDEKTGALMMEFHIPESDGQGVSISVNDYAGAGERSLKARSNEEFFQEVARAVGLEVDRR